MADASRDGNFVTTLLGASSVDGTTPVKVYADPTSHRLLVDLAGATGGTVTSISQSTGILLTPNPITTTGTVGLSTAVAPIASLAGNSLKFLRVNAGETAVEYASPTDTGITQLTGDVTAGPGSGSQAATLATVNGNVGSFGSATQASVITVNAKGLITAASNSTVTPAVGSITGLGANVATALGVAVGSAGAFVVNGGVLGTPSSGTVTNLTGTASININGTVGATTPTTGSFTTVTTSGNIELGNASDTTLARVSAGVVSVEGVRVITSAGTTSGTILKNNGTTFVASTETYASPGTSGNVLTSDGTNWTSATPSSGTTVTTISPAPQHPGEGNVNVQQTSSTAMRVVLLSFPFSINATQITYNVSAVGAAGTLKIALYTADGATKVFEVTTASISTTGIKTTTFSSTPIAAGNYYLGFCLGSSTDMSLTVWDTGVIVNPVFNPSGKAIVGGNVTITANTIPSTISPTAITASNTTSLIARFDN